MRFFTCLLIGSMAVYPGNLLAQDADSPPAAQAPPPEKVPQANLNDLPEDLEEIRRALGPRYSIDSQELDLPFDRPREADSASPRNKGVEAAENRDGRKTIEQEFKEVSQTIRSLARRLERLAADAEEQSQYARADQLREIARVQWQSAREILGPLPVPVPDTDGSALRWQHHPQHRAAFDPGSPPYPAGPQRQASPDHRPSGPWWSPPDTRPPIPPSRKPQVDGNPRP